MSSNKKSIDDLFKDRLLNEQTGFNPAHWDKMAGLLDKQFVPPSISSGAATTISSAVKILIISVSISVPALLYVIIGTDIFKKEQLNIEKITNSVQNDIENDTAIYSIHSTSSTIEKVNEVKTSSSKNETIKIEEHTNNILAKSSYIHTQKALYSNDVNKPEEIKESSNNTSFTKVTNNKTDIVSNNEVNNTLADNKQKEPIESNKEVIQETSNNQNNKDAEIETNITDNKSPVSMSKNDSMSIPEIESSYFPLQKYRGLYAYLGVNYGKSFSDLTENNNSDYFSPIFGIGFEKSLKKDKYALMIELLYMKSINHSFVKTLISKSYFLDEETTIRSLNSYELEYFRMPVIFKYNLNKHHILAGFYASYLLNTKSILSENIISQSVNKNTSNIVTGYRDGFNDFSYGLILGYNYSLSKMFDLGFRFNFSPADLSKNAYYQNSNIDHLSEFQFNILWKLY